jgi:hypothetical protein
MNYFKFFISYIYIMSCDKLVFDLSQEIEGSPNVFLKKDWLSILDNQNGNYGGNQSVIDTSQLSNSNKYLSYREAYLSVPLLLTLTSDAIAFGPATFGTSCDYTLGLKNWFGSIIHSLTLDYNGTTIIQQTPFINMWNSFKLMTSLSWNDVNTIGSTIGFYPDDPLSWSYSAVASASGVGVCNNTNFTAGGNAVVVNAFFNNYGSDNGNVGLLKRQQYINYDADGDSGSSTYGSFLTAVNASTLWKSHISQKVNAAAGAFQISVRATIYLKHIHSFFQMCPLLKGVFMKLTLTLNNSSCEVVKAGAPTLGLTSSNVPVGGVQPLMIASSKASNGGAAGLPAGNYVASLSVGSRCLVSSQLAKAGVVSGKVGDNIQLYVPSYVLNPPFEQALLSSPIKTINYTDVYQYQVLNVASGGSVNSLLTNGLAGIKSVLVIPFFTAVVPNGAGVLGSTPPYQSPFDPAGCGATSPLCLLTNFNVVVSGQNAIYNTIRYSAETFNNQLYGTNAVNGGMTDGLTSGLINSLGFEMEYCYHYVDVSRMLPVEESVPKSVQLIGQNTSGNPLNLWCFVEYGQSVQIDVLTGARV